VFLLLKHLATF